MGIVGFNPEGRPALDFYPTPPAATEALLRVETFDPGYGPIWEPAAGDGAIVKVLRAAGHQVTASDIADYGFPCNRVDFLDPRIIERGIRVGSVVTNPPYKDAQAFVEQALKVSGHKVAMLLKLAFLEGQKRQEFFRRTPLARVHVFSQRLSLTRNGEPMKNGGMIAFAWFVWERSHDGAPTINWI